MRYAWKADEAGTYKTRNEDAGLCCQLLKNRCLNTIPLPGRLHYGFPPYW